LVWVVAAAIPAAVGYMRYQAGMHFLSDNLLGYALGAASGILIPQWHKSKRHNNVSFSPLIGKDYKGVSFVYNIK
jgi:membrane-associated phospholipid phosphatase